MAQQHLPAAIDAARGDAGRRVILEGLAERAALAAVERQHGRIGRDAGKRVVDHSPRDAGGGRFARHRGDEGAKIPTALRRKGGRCERSRKNERREKTPDHAETLSLAAAIFA